MGLEVGEQGTRAFGTWLQEIGRDRGLDARAIARRSGVEIGTITRLQNLNAEPSLCTAVRICRGLGLSPVDLVAALEDRGHLEFLEGELPSTSEEDVLTPQDVEAFVAYFDSVPSEATSRLADWLNLIYSAASKQRVSGAPEVEHLIAALTREINVELPRLFVPEDIGKLLMDVPLFHFELAYPPEPDADSILQTYVQGGVVTFQDVGSYARQRRRQSKLVLTDVATVTQFSKSLLSRVESGSLERIKLDDVLTLDRLLARSGEIIGMYWSVCTFHDDLTLRYSTGLWNTTTRAAREMWMQLRIADTFIIVCRWLQHLTGNTVWLPALRTLLVESSARR